MAMIKLRNYVYALMLMGFIFSAVGLQGQGATPKNMLEVGVHGGYFFYSGDVAQKPGYAGGIHIRKATDYMFSLRADAMYGKASGETSARDFESTWISGTVFGVFNLNSLRFDKSIRPVTYYAMAGAGGNYYTTDFNNEEQRMGTIDYGLAPHASIGAGVAIRVSPRFNIGIEHQSSILFGNRSDKLDGSYLENGVRSSFRDLVHYAHIQLNFNLGDPTKLSEPLYWVNPLDGVMEQVADVKKRQDEILQDSDGDGIIDALDQEPDTPTDVPVDTKGRTLDSDKDGVADYMDKEPYYPPRAGEEVNEEGVVINPISSRSGGVTEDRVQEMIDASLAKYGMNEGSGTIAEMFLPMIHFGTDSYTIKYSDYGTLSSIAKVLKGNDKLRLVVSGHADQRGEDNYNSWLSYKRAEAIINHLVNNYGIGRGRLVLQWEGQSSPLVPKGGSYMNRRVEFRTAKAGDVEMDAPVGGPDNPDGY